MKEETITSVTALEVPVVLEGRALMPYYGSAGAGAVDLATPERVVIHPGQMVTVDTGVAVAIPDGYVGLVFGRSGLAFKYGIRLANSVAVIDSDFRGTIKCGLYCDGSVAVEVPAASRIAQLLVIQAPKLALLAVGTLPATDRGVGGLGSTGIEHIGMPIGAEHPVNR